MILIDSVDDETPQSLKLGERSESRISTSQPGWYFAEYSRARDYHLSLVQAANAVRRLAGDSQRIQQYSTHDLAYGLLRMVRSMTGWLW